MNTEEASVTVKATSDAYFWVNFHGTRKTFEDKFQSKANYAFRFDPDTQRWWLLYADLNSTKWEEAGEIFGDHGLEEDLPQQFRTRRPS